MTARLLMAAVPRVGFGSAWLCCPGPPLNALHLLGSALTVILPFAFFPFGVYLAYLYYATALPPALLDAARVDGCGEWATFRRIALPLARPLVALVVFFSFATDWTSFVL